MHSGRATSSLMFYRSFFKMHISACQHSTWGALRKAVHRGQLRQARSAYDSLSTADVDRPLLRRLVRLAGSSQRRDDYDFLKRVMDEMPKRFQQKPSPMEYNTLLGASGQHEGPERALGVMEEMKRAGVEPNLYTYNLLLNCFKKHGQVAAAEALWKRMGPIEPDAVTYNTLLQLWRQTNEGDRLFDFFRDQVKVADVYTYTIVLDAAMAYGAPEEGQRAFEALLKQPKLDTAAMNTMLRYKSADVEGCLALYRRLRCRPDQKTFNILLDACLKQGAEAEARRVYEEMKKKKIKPDEVTYGTWIDAKKRAGDLEGALDLLEAMPIDPSGRILNRLVSMAKEATREQLDRLVRMMEPYEARLDRVGSNAWMGILARLGRSEKAQAVYDRVFRQRPPDVVTFTHLTLAYINDDCLDDAFDIYRVLRDDHRHRGRVQLDAPFYSTLIAALTSLKTSERRASERLQMALSLFGDMRSLGLQPSRHTYTALLHAAGQYKEGYVLEHVHGLMKVDPFLDPDTALYNALMDAYNRTGDGQTVLDLWQQLVSSDVVTIDPASVSIVLDSCGHNGYPERARAIWRELKQAGFELNANNYNSYVECLCRSAGREGWDQALALVKEEMSRPGRYRPNRPEMEAKTVNTLLGFARKKGWKTEAMEELESWKKEL
ncbi:hypothetical protein G6F47_009015 [Rhizopus delemar]|uniref:Pentacotripeptide-repeat region of PRORP domain-containing protein n=1 Tax=Rhizopus delemar (strain RA 99-880 / ATCC MYA-4621 / FGSC 9543 / NRRL 43880) TaxID=246409 RepID=I1CDI4_RHIO9|nr:hypothetical protein RO3G_11225 [Rhizopus delemar RA 99-880]KAG1491003.1 hypothetical protein G6F54_010326 [Rhizopus delemar]KAG1507262.1 hypothetical protein G6F53_009082 [Rhizopus delemar]KAG1593749.1 hypothetical protein G6F47_009015 [Rhizopus delemar]|eukprot:EIE86514.1 hypothetical protein RO3G_11225 [Rhizopus delemar RA 99-880]